MDNSGGPSGAGRRALMLVGICVVIGLGAVALVNDAVRVGSRHGGHSMAGLVISAVLTVFGCAVLVRLMWRTRRGDRAVSSVVPAGTSRQDWEQAMRAVRGGVPSTDPERADLERGIAGRLNRPFPPVVLLALAAGCVALALARHTATAGRPFFGLLAALSVAGAVWLAINIRRARRYLAAAGRDLSGAAPGSSGP
jgi:hypothetical protein